MYIFQILGTYCWLIHSVVRKMNPEAVLSVLRCDFSSSEQTQDWLRRLTAALRPPTRLDELFAFAFHTCSASVPAERDLHYEICHAGTGYTAPQLTHAYIIIHIYRTLD